MTRSQPLSELVSASQLLCVLGQVTRCPDHRLPMGKGRRPEPQPRRAVWQPVGVWGRRLALPPGTWPGLQSSVAGCVGTTFGEALSLEGSSPGQGRAGPGWASGASCRGEPCLEAHSRAESPQQGPFHNQALL